MEQGPIRGDGMTTGTGQQRQNLGLPSRDSAVPLTRASVRAMIRDVFADLHCLDDAAIPRGDTGRWVARYGDSYEGAEVARLFAGKTWDQVDLDLLRHPLGGFHQQAFSFLSDEAVGYYAPALMLIALEHGFEADTFLSDAIDIFETGFSEDPGSMDRRLGAYTAGQRAAVRAFLHVMAAEEFEGAPNSKPARLLAGRWR